jgi:RNA polymerase sigma factor (sigma-70 family)
MASVAQGLVPQVKTPLRRSAMSGSARAADEARLAGEAAARDGDAFAELYGRYQQRAYNLCYRILGSEDDAADATQEAFVGVFKRLPNLQGRELAFGSYVFTSARNACYDLIERRRRAEPSDQIPESSIPVGGGGFGLDPGDPEDDPSGTCCSPRARRRSAPPMRPSPSASARSSPCGSWRSSRTTRSPRSWT